MNSVNSLPVARPWFCPRRSITAMLRFFVWALAMLGSSHAFAQQATRIHLRVVGGLDGVSQFTKHERPFWTSTLAAKTQGRVTAEIVAFDKAGIRPSEMLGLVSTGVVPIGTFLVGASSAEMPELGAIDLAGASPDIVTLRSIVESFRPYLAQRLRQEKAMELLAVYAYPGQVLFCREAFRTLSDLRGRRIRTATPSQSDFVEALGGISVRTPFGEVSQNLTQRNVDCVITGSMSGNTIGIHHLTSHVHTLPISWGLSIAVAHQDFWNQLPADLRHQLKTELLPTLEAQIWESASREFSEGLDCNVGEKSCLTGKKGRMQLVQPTERDQQLRKELFQQVVLPRWVQRCGDACVSLWNTHFKKLNVEAQSPR